MEIRTAEEIDKLSQEMLSSIPKNPAIDIAYPDVLHPSSLLSNFNVRDDTRTLAAFEDGQFLGLASCVLSKATFLPPSFLNRIFFILSLKKPKNIEDRLIEKIGGYYMQLGVPEVSYIRIAPVDTLSPSGRRLGKHGYKKRFSLRRMARPLDNIPKADTASIPAVRRVKWAKQDLLLFMKTWARGFGWPAKYIQPVAEGMAEKFLERHQTDPDSWINFLVKRNGQPVGTAAFLTFPESAYVVNVSTLPAFRRQGLAMGAMIQLMEWCKAQGMKYMTLDTDETAALNLYRKLGFKEYGESAGYVKKFNQ